MTEDRERQFNPICRARRLSPAAPPPARPCALDKVEDFSSSSDRQWQPREWRTSPSLLTAGSVATGDRVIKKNVRSQRTKKCAGLACAAP